MRHTCAPTHSRVAVSLLAAPSTASCSPAQFLSPLKPVIAFDPSTGGAPLGTINVTVDAATGATTWTQAVGVLQSQSPGGAPALAARVLAGDVLLGQGPTILMQP